jgi:hypothetical protein
MHAPDRDPLALDRSTADRLLAGTLDPDDAPPAYAAVARVLAAAAAPPSPGERAGEAEAVARFAAARTGGRARKRRLARFVVASAAVLGLLSAGGAVSATGGVPQAGRWLDRAVEAVVGRSPTEGAATIATPARITATTSAASGRSGSVPAPGATVQRGGTQPERLCAAWRPGKGERMDGASLQALAAAAGGADRIPEFCRAQAPAGGGANHDADRGKDKGKGDDKGLPAPPGNQRGIRGGGE